MQEDRLPDSGCMEPLNFGSLRGDAAQDGTDGSMARLAKGLGAVLVAAEPASRAFCARPCAPGLPLLLFAPHMRSAEWPSGPSLAIRDAATAGGIALIPSPP